MPYTFISPGRTNIRSRAACISAMMSGRNGVDNWLSVPFGGNSESTLCKTKPCATVFSKRCGTHRSHVCSHSSAVIRLEQWAALLNYLKRSGNANMSLWWSKPDDSQHAERKHDCRSLSCLHCACARSSCFGALACWFDRLDYQLEMAGGRSLVLKVLCVDGDIRHVTLLF